MSDGISNDVFDTPQTEPDVVTEISVTDFWCDMRSHRYIYEPTGDMWPASSVDARLAPVPAADGKPMRLQPREQRAQRTHRAGDRNVESRGKSRSSRSTRL